MSDLNCVHIVKLHVHIHMCVHDLENRELLCVKCQLFKDIKLIN